MSEPQQIHALISAIREDIGEIKKEKTGKTGVSKYKYRGVDDALNHVGRALTKHKVTPSVTVSDFQIETNIEDSKAKGKRFVYHATLRLTLRLTAPDGSFVENTAAGEGVDWTNDKATNKAMAGAFKYACYLGLVLPVEEGELDDSDAEGKDPEKHDAEAVGQRLEVRLNGPCERGQLERLVELAELLGKDKAWLKGNLERKYEVATAKDLKFRQAEEAISALEAKANEADNPF